MKELKYGFIYSYIHFIIEIVSFFILTKYLNNSMIFLIDLLYDFLAFVPQEILGYIFDEKVKINFGLIGWILSCLALILMYFNVIPLIVIMIIAIGNAMVHIQGAEITLRTGNGLISPSAIFVAGGSFGLITGKLLAINNFSILFILLINLTMLVPILFTYNNAKLDFNPLKKYNFELAKINTSVILILTTLVVTIRSFMGYGIPTTWNKTDTQTIMLYSFMGIGKALGGISIDKIGIKKTIFISTICSIPFLIFGNNQMYISLFGVMMFSMTMAITLAILVSALPKYPGIAFGLTTIGLFIGTLPMFVLKLDNLVVNIYIIIVLAFISYISLNYIIRKE